MLPPKGLPVQNLVPVQDSAGAKAPKKQRMSLKSSSTNITPKTMAVPIQHTVQGV